jgi:hypothetical protein
LTAREALTVTLANPAAVKDIPAEQLTKLKAVLNGPGDPEKVVQKVYDFMANDYWFRKGAAQNRASAFYQTYLTELNSRMDKSKQIDAALLMNQLNDLDKEGQEVVHKRDDLIASQAPFLTKDQIASSHDVHPIAPPVNPADALKDVQKPETTNGDWQGPPIPVQQSAPPPVTGLGDAIESGGVYALPSAVRDVLAQKNAATKASMNSVADVVAKPIGNFLEPYAQGLFSQAPNSAPAPTQQEIQANRRPLPASPAEVEQVKQLAKSMGADPVKGEQAMSSPDPQVRGQAVASFNLLLRQVRQRSMGMNTEAPPVPSSDATLQ